MYGARIIKLMAEGASCYNAWRWRKHKCAYMPIAWGDFCADKKPKTCGAVMHTDIAGTSAWGGIGHCGAKWLG